MNAPAMFLLDVSGLEGRPTALGALQASSVVPHALTKQIRKLAIADMPANRANDVIAGELMPVRDLSVKFFFNGAQAIRWPMS